MILQIFQKYVTNITFINNNWIPYTYKLLCTISQDGQGLLLYQNIRNKLQGSIIFFHVNDVIIVDA